MHQATEIRKQLELLKPELERRFNVRTIGLFGSIVRDDFNSESDVDILVDFKQPIGIEFIDLANLIESQLKRKVDLVSRNGVKSQYFDVIAKEIVYV